MLNALPILQREIKAGNVPSDLAHRAEALVSKVQQDIVEITGRTGDSGIYHSRPYWGSSAAETSLKFNPESRPSAEEPLKGHPAFQSSYSQSGRWGFQQERRLQCSDQGIVFEYRMDGRSSLTVSMSADGTCKVEADPNPDPNSWCPGA